MDESLNRMGHFSLQAGSIPSMMQLDLKKNEWKVFILFMVSLLIRVHSSAWANLLVYASLLLLMLSWVFLNRQAKRKLTEGFTTMEMMERLSTLLFIWGVALSVTEISGSVIFLRAGLFLMLIFQLVKGIMSIRKTALYGIESILVAVVLLTFLMRLFWIPGNGPLRVISMTFFTMVYMGLGFYYINIMVAKRNVKTGIFCLGLSMACAIYLLSIQFTTFFWPGGVSLFYAASILTFGLGMIYFIWPVVFTPEPNELHTLMKRLIIVGCISGFFALAPQSQFLRFIYGNRPALIKAYLNCRIQPPVDPSAKDDHCRQFDLLNQKFEDGNYREGEF